MMLLILLTAGVSLFWAINMGASGFGVCFSPAYGARLISFRRAIMIYTIALTAGALLVGGRVVKTLSKGIIPLDRIENSNPEAALLIVCIILIGAALSLFIANKLRIPQSTSIIIVGSIIGAGIFLQDLNINTILWLVFIWIAFSLLSYISTFILARVIYPPRKGNFHLYEKFFRHEKKIIALTLVANSYAAFGIGTNNVANVVGPLVGAGVFKHAWIGLLIFSPMFGVGAVLLGEGVLKTTSRQVIPLGTVSAALMSIVTSTFLIASSILKFPAPYVQLAAMSLLAIHTVKEEIDHTTTLRHPITVKFLKVWVFTPLLGLGVTCSLLILIKLLLPEMIVL